MDDPIAGEGPVRWILPPDEWPREVHASLSLRAGGVSPRPFDSLNLGRSAGDDLDRVAENEAIWSCARGLPGPPARAKLAHGVDLVRVDRPGVYAPYDALLTDRPGLPLWLTVADCYPVFLTGGACVAVVHCGWRGAAAGAAGIAAREIASASGLPPGSIHAWIGPGVGACCYPVGEDVAARFPRERITAREGRLHLELGGAIEDDLLRSGLRPERIARTELCTSCHSDLFFSYRRDGPRSGRMAAVIWR
jgi:polyphenol oxidase